MATAIPSIVADLGGFSLFSWVFSAFLLAQVVTIPIYGKLADSYGRKRRLAVVGGIWILMGSIFFITLRPERGWIWAGVGSLLIGFGMGLARTIFIVGIQDRVKWEMRGVVTASNMFMNILGNALGAAVLGGIVWIGNCATICLLGFVYIVGTEFDFDYVFSFQGKGLGLSV